MATPTAPDDPGIQPWKPRQPVKADRLNALQSAVITDLQVGPGLKLIRKGNQAIVALKEQFRSASAFWVRIEGYAGGTGIYIGHRLDISANININGVDLSTEWRTTGEEIVIVNVYEPDSSTGHSLIEEPAQTDHLATWGGGTTEPPARRVAYIQGLSFAECGGNIDGGTF